MSGRLATLVERQNKIWNRMQDIQDSAEREGRDWTAEERTNWDAAEADLTLVSGDIDRLQRAAKLDTPVLPPAGGDEGRTAASDADQPVEDRDAKYAEAFGKFLRGGMDGVSAEQRNLMMENRASPQGVGTPADGGFLVPPGYRDVMTEALKAYGGLINLANVITTSTGNPLQWPTNDDTGNVGAILSENTALTELGVTIGTKSIGAFTYTSKLVRVSLQLLQDSAFNLDSWLPTKLGERIGRAVADHLVNGTGTTMPFGILPTATSATSLTIANFAAGATGYDAMIALEHSVDPAYRQMGNCRFLFNDATLAIIRKMKDSQNRPLWLPVPVPGQPATVNGQPYTIDQAMPSAGVAGKPVLFGDFKAGYLVRQSLDVQMVRLAERYAEMLQVGYFSFMRLDATPDDANAVRALTVT